MKSLEDIEILVIGDIMLDKYILGEVERISPEAPVPIVHVYNEYSTLGGCGNVVRNIKELGPKVTCLASIGNDDNGEIISRKLYDLDVERFLTQQSDTTITKERVIASERKIQMIRIDREVAKPVDATHIIESFKTHDKEYDIIVISDYAKGMITKDLMDYLHTRPERIIIDPKPKNKNIYGQVYLITPNEKESSDMGGSINLISSGYEYVLETKGKRGMTLHGKRQFWSIPADEVEVYNVSGAGDTVIAIMATALSMGWNPLDSAYIANKCASYVVTKSGTSTVPKNIFMKLLKEYKKGIY